MSALVILVIALLIQSIICDKFDPTTHSAWNLVNDKSCGIRTQQRVLGGSDAGIGEFPWVVQIGKIQGENEFEFTGCVGAIISTKFILTAAHCQQSDPSFNTTVVAGELDLSRDPDCDTNDVCPPSAKQFKVEKFIPQPEYVNDMGHDIALAKIEGEFEFDEYIAPICLEYGPLLDEDYAGGEAEFAGWGNHKIDSGTNETSDSYVLQKITMTIQGTKECNELYLGIENDTLEVDAPFLCAGGQPEQRIDYGDSGGVLAIARTVDEDIPRFFGIGVDFLGVYTDEEPEASKIEVFARISFYLEWILDTIANESGIE